MARFVPPSQRPKPKPTGLYVSEEDRMAVQLAYECGGLAMPENVKRGQAEAVVDALPFVNIRPRWGKK